MSKNSPNHNSPKHSDSLWLLIPNLIIALLVMVATWLQLLPESKRCKIIPIFCLPQCEDKQQAQRLFDEGQNLVKDGDQMWEEYLRSLSKRRSGLARIKPKYEQALRTFNRVSPDCLSSSQKLYHLIGVSEDTISSINNENTRLIKLCGEYSDGTGETGTCL